MKRAAVPSPPGHGWEEGSAQRISSCTWAHGLPQMSNQGRRRSPGGPRGALKQVPELRPLPEMRCSSPWARGASEQHF